jgi:hemerythrin-like domain-containing protein
MTFATLWSVFQRAVQLDDRDFDSPLEFLSDCHRRIEYCVDVLLRITRSRAGQSLSSDEWAEIAKAVDYFETDEPWHAADEMQSLFPRLRETADERAQALVVQLEHDQEMANAHHRMIAVFCRRWLGHGYLSTVDTRNLTDRLEGLQAVYRRHIAIEDRDLFLLAAHLLSPRQLQVIGREMAARRSASH